MTGKKPMEGSENEAKSIEVDLVPKREIPPSRIYSNFAHVSQTPFDFSIKFCDATPIPAGDNTKGKRRHEIPIVAEIVIPFGLMPGLINALQTQYNIYKARFGGDKNAKEASEKL
jgi:hypothetical protein